MKPLFKRSFLVFLIVVFSSPAFSKPVAILPADKTATLGEVIAIDGSSSFDEEGNNLTYSWSLDISPQNFNSQIDNPTNSSISFTADTAGFYLIRLIVNNGTENSYPAYMVIRVKGN
ncbi:MAG: hypothetical protein OXJ52_06265 [Oligoflexia bacterium]|nr:hypothetical protein [Oligoflexia bacterium]